MDQDKAPSRPRGARVRQTEINRRRLLQTALLGAAAAPLASHAFAQGDGSGGGRGSRQGTPGARQGTPAASQGTPVANPVPQPDVIPATAVDLERAVGLAAKRLARPTTRAQCRREREPRRHRRVRQSQRGPLFL